MSLRSAKRLSPRMFAVVGLLALRPALAVAQTSDDALDWARGAEIAESSPTVPGFGPEGLIGGATKGESNSGATIFTNGGVNFVEILTPKPETIEGVVLYCRADSIDPDAPRSVAKFSFAADADDDGEFEVMLVNGAVPTNQGLANRYTFPAVTAASFRAEFEAGSTPHKERAGPRILELDSVGAPRSLAVLWESLGGAGVIVLLAVGVLIRRRSVRKTASGG